MSGIHISIHAAERYIERIDPTADMLGAVRALRSHERAIVCAARFGCRYLKLGDGSRLVLDGLTVVTVIGRDQRLRLPGVGA